LLPFTSLVPETLLTARSSSSETRNLS